MKRALKIVGVLVIVLIAAVAGVLAATFLGRQSITDGAEYGRVRIIKDGIVSVGMVDLDGQHVALVDAGNDGDAKAILAELSRRHLTPDAVTTIFITHGHADHTAGIRNFPHAQVMALDREAAAIEGKEGFHGPVTRLMPARPTGVTVARSLHDGETVMVGSTPVRVFAVPGHTAGSAAYLVDGVLFMGDAADADDRGTIKPAPWVFSDSQSEDRASLVRLANRLSGERIPVTVVAFAHSGTRTDGLSGLLVFAKTNE